MGQVAAQASALHDLVTHAPVALRTLLRVPFNLRLMAELLDAGVRPGDLTPIQSQIELLDRYWAERVIRDDGNGDARENVLRSACEEMVLARALRVDRSRVSSDGVSLRDLLSTQVLMEWQSPGSAAPDRYLLTFSHHVLFDYAAARLLFRGDPEAVTNRLVGDPELALIVRPSLSMHFEYLWSRDPRRGAFWDLVIRFMQRDEIPKIGKLIGPSVAVRRVKQLTDLNPLCEYLQHRDTTIQRAAEQAFCHLAGSLLAESREDVPLAGPAAGPWSELLERVTRNQEGSA